MKFKKLLYAISSVVLAVGMMPLPAFATTSASGGESDVSSAAIVGTEGVDFATGEVVVAVRGGQEALDEATSASGIAQALGATGNKVGASSFTVGETLASVSASDIEQAAEEFGTTDNVNLNANGAQALSADADDIEIILLSVDDVAQAIADLQQLDCVVLAQPNYYYQSVDDEEAATQVADAIASATQSTEVSSRATAGTASTAETATAQSAESGTSGTAEPYFQNQWSLQNEETLLANGYSNTTSLNVQDTWGEGAGNEEGGEVVVAVVDSGVDYTHQDLKDSMWTGGTAKWSTDLGGGMYGFNGLTDSPSGTIDHSDPMDVSNGHGTHCASTIAGSWNGEGIAGVNNQVKIMAIRCIPTNGKKEATTSSILLGYNYLTVAKENGVNVVAANNSWGGGSSATTNDTLTESMIYKAGEDGVISVFAAGNSGYDNDLVSTSTFETSNPYIVTVGALASNSQAASFSQYGAASTTVFAPGTQVLAGVSSYGMNHDSSMYCSPQYLPWLSGSAGAQSTYFIDDAESPTCADGVTYDLVSFTSSTFENPKQVNNIRDTSANGYASDSALKFCLYQDDGTGNSLFDINDNIAIRVNIPAATWASYKDKAEAEGLTEFYIGAIGGINNLGSGAQLLALVNINSSWGILNSGLTYISKADGNWCSLSSDGSMESFESGTDDEGNFHFYLLAAPLSYDEGQTSFTEDDYIYLDNLSLGWAAGTKNDEGQVDNTYYYMNGTSMATPNTTGTISLLCSHAAAISNDENYLQDADTAKQIISFIKGGVTQLDSTSSLCTTGGAVNAYNSYTAFKTYEAATTDAQKLSATDSLKPVPNNIVDNEDGTFTLKGSFFGEKTDESTLVFNNTDLTSSVTSWSDTEITFTANVYGKERTGKIEVTKRGIGDSGKAEDLTGQAYLTMPEGSEATGTFNSLPTPSGFDITLENLDDTGVTLTASIDELMPSKMAAAGGYIYLFGVIHDIYPVLVRYDIAQGAWDQKNYLEGTLDYDIGGFSPSTQSVVAGESEVYLWLFGTSFDLITIDAATGAVKSDIKLPNTLQNAYGSLVVYNGELLLVGGKAGEPVYSAIYPDTGAIYRSSKATLETNTMFGTASTVTATLPTTGTQVSEICITGSGNTLGLYSAGYTNGSINQEIMITLDAEGEPTLATSSQRFFFDQTGVSDKSLDAGQVFTNVAVAAVDGSLLVTGPVFKNEQSNMRDTWRYSVLTNSWYQVTTTRFAPRALARAAACVYDGTYYVIGLDRSLDQSESSQFLRFGSYPLSKLGFTDTLTAASITDAAHDITATVESSEVRLGQTACLTCTAKSATSTDLSYQWQYSKDGKVWSNCTATGAKTSNFTPKATKYRAGLQFRCVVTADGQHTVCSDAVRINVVEPEASVTTAPVKFGSKATFSCSVEGLGSSSVESYQWQYSSNNGETWKNGTAAGATSADYQPYASKSHLSNKYRCIVTLDDGTTVTSDEATFDIAEPTVSVSTTAVELGQTASFVCKVKGYGTCKPAYQWQYSKNNGETWLPCTATGATTNNFTPVATTYRAGLLFRCVTSYWNDITVASDPIKMEII